jgi:hypothetical protein
MLARMRLFRFWGVRLASAAKAGRKKSSYRSDKPLRHPKSSATPQPKIKCNRATQSRLQLVRLVAISNNDLTP